MLYSNFWHLWCQSILADANWKWLCLSFSFPSFILFLLFSRSIKYITIKLKSNSYIPCLLWFSLDSTIKCHSITDLPFACLIPANNSEQSHLLDMQEVTWPLQVTHHQFVPLVIAVKGTMRATGTLVWDGSKHGRAVLPIEHVLHINEDKIQFLFIVMMCS